MAKASIALRAQTRFERLLSHGFFPAELPPPFTTKTFAAQAQHFATTWNLANIQDKFWTTPEFYSVPRFQHARRKLSIVNPVNQLLVAKLIADNFPAIRKKMRRSNTTEFKARMIVAGAGRSINSVDFDSVARRRIRILSEYGRYIKTDVAQFYPSVYTHSIAWSILGKAQCKANFKTLGFKSSFANQLDRAISAGQNGQTSGLPIGPDTSRIISELIIVEVEESIKTNIPDWSNRTVRYVDDMIIGLAETESPASILAELSSGLYEFELELNAAKTDVLGLGTGHKPEWSHYIISFVLDQRPTRQREDLDSFFEQVLYLQDENPRDSVLLYAVKRASTFPIADENASHFIRWMLYSARRSPNCLAFVAEHLAAASRNKGHTSKEIESYITSQLPLKAAALHTEEVAWLLFWVLEIGLKLPAEVLSKVVLLRSSVVAIMVFDLLRQGRIVGTLDTSFWRSFATNNGLSSEMWMMAYEITKKGWWPTHTKTGYITGHQYYADIYSKDVSFYDTEKRAQTRTKFSFSLSSMLKMLESGRAYYN